MSQFSLLGSRRFAPFFWTQALGAFNDNAFRNALVMLVAFQMGLDDHTVSLYTNLHHPVFPVLGDRRPAGGEIRKDADHPCGEAVRDRRDGA